MLNFLNTNFTYTRGALIALFAGLFILSACGGAGTKELEAEVIPAPPNPCDTNPFGTACTTPANQAARTTAINNCLASIELGQATPACTNVPVAVVNCLNDPFDTGCVATQFATAAQSPSVLLDVVKTNRVGLCRGGSRRTGTECTGAVVSMCDDNTSPFELLCGATNPARRAIVTACIENDLIEDSSRNADCTAATDAGFACFANPFAPGCETNADFARVVDDARTKRLDYCDGRGGLLTDGGFDIGLCNVPGAATDAGSTLCADSGAGANPFVPFCNREGNAYDAVRIGFINNCFNKEADGANCAVGFVASGTGSLVSGCANDPWDASCSNDLFDGVRSSLIRACTGASRNEMNEMQCTTAAGKGTCLNNPFANGCSEQLGAEGLRVAQNNVIAFCTGNDAEVSANNFCTSVPAGNVRTCLDNPFTATNTAADAGADINCAVSLGSAEAVTAAQRNVIALCTGNSATVGADVRCMALTTAGGDRATCLANPFTATNTDAGSEFDCASANALGSGDAVTAAQRNVIALCTGNSNAVTANARCTTLTGIAGNRATCLANPFTPNSDAENAVINCSDELGAETLMTAQDNRQTYCSETTDATLCNSFRDTVLCLGTNTNARTNPFDPLCNDLGTIDTLRTTFCGLTPIEGATGDEPTNSNPQCAGSAVKTACDANPFGTDCFFTGNLYSDDRDMDLTACRDLADDAARLADTTNCDDVIKDAITGSSDPEDDAPAVTVATCVNDPFHADCTRDIFKDDRVAICTETTITSISKSILNAGCTNAYNKNLTMARQTFVDGCASVGTTAGCDMKVSTVEGAPLISLCNTNPFTAGCDATIFVKARMTYCSADATAFNANCNSHEDAQPVREVLAKLCTETPEDGRCTTAILVEAVIAAPAVIAQTEIVLGQLWDHDDNPETDDVAAEAGDVRPAIEGKDEVLPADAITISSCGLNPFLPACTGIALFDSARILHADTCSTGGLADDDRCAQVVRADACIRNPFTPACNTPINALIYKHVRANRYTFCEGAAVGTQDGTGDTALCAPIFAEICSWNGVGATGDRLNPFATICDVTDDSGVNTNLVSRIRYCGVGNNRNTVENGGVDGCLTVGNTADGCLANPFAATCTGVDTSAENPTITEELRTFLETRRRAYCNGDVNAETFDATLCTTGAVNFQSLVCVATGEDANPFANFCTRDGNNFAMVRQDFVTNCATEDETARATALNGATCSAGVNACINDPLARGCVDEEAYVLVRQAIVGRCVDAAYAQDAVTADVVTTNADCLRIEAIDELECITANPYLNNRQFVPAVTAADAVLGGDDGQTVITEAVIGMPAISALDCLGNTTYAALRTTLTTTTCAAGASAIANEARCAFSPTVICGSADGSNNANPFDRELCFADGAPASYATNRKTLVDTCVANPSATVCTTDINTCVTSPFAITMVEGVSCQDASIQAAFDGARLAHCNTAVNITDSRCVDFASAGSTDSGCLLNPFDNNCVSRLNALGGATGAADAEAERLNYCNGTVDVTVTAQVNLCNDVAGSDDAEGHICAAGGEETRNLFSPLCTRVVNGAVDNAPTDYSGLRKALVDSCVSSSTAPGCTNEITSCISDPFGAGTVDGKLCNTDSPAASVNVIEAAFDGARVILCNTGTNIANSNCETFARDTDNAGYECVVNPFTAACRTELDRLKAGSNIPARIARITHCTDVVDVAVSEDLAFCDATSGPDAEAEICTNGGSTNEDLFSSLCTRSGNTYANLRKALVNSCQESDTGSGCTAEINACNDNPFDATARFATNGSGAAVGCADARHTAAFNDRRVAFCGVELQANSGPSNIAVGDCTTFAVNNTATYPCLANPFGDACTDANTGGNLATARSNRTTWCGSNGNSSDFRSSSDRSTICRGAADFTCTGDTLFTSGGSFDCLNDGDSDYVGKRNTQYNICAGAGVANGDARCTNTKVEVCKGSDGAYTNPFLNLCTTGDAAQNLGHRRAVITACKGGASSQPRCNANRGAASIVTTCDADPVLAACNDYNIAGQAYASENTQRLADCALSTHGAHECGGSRVIFCNVGSQENNIFAALCDNTPVDSRGRDIAAQRRAIITVCLGNENSDRCNNSLATTIVTACRNRTEAHNPFASVSVPNVTTAFDCSTQGGLDALRAGYITACRKPDEDSLSESRFCAIDTVLGKICRDTVIAAGESDPFNALCNDAPDTAARTAFANACAPGAGAKIGVQCTAAVTECANNPFGSTCVLPGTTNADPAYNTQRRAVLDTCIEGAETASGGNARCLAALPDVDCLKDPINCTGTVADFDQATLGAEYLNTLKQNRYEYCNIRDNINTQKNICRTAATAPAYCIRNPFDPGCTAAGNRLGDDLVQYRSDREAYCRGLSAEQAIANPSANGSRGGGHTDNTANINLCDVSDRTHDTAGVICGTWNATTQTEVTSLGLTRDPFLAFCSKITTYNTARSTRITACAGFSTPSAAGTTVCNWARQVTHCANTDTAVNSSCGELNTALKWSTAATTGRSGDGRISDAIDGAITFTNSVGTTNAFISDLAVTNSAVIDFSSHALVQTTGIAPARITDTVLPNVRFYSAQVPAVNYSCADHTGGTTCVPASNIVISGGTVKTENDVRIPAGVARFYAGIEVDSGHVGRPVFNRGNEAATWTGAIHWVGIGDTANPNATARDFNMKVDFAARTIQGAVSIPTSNTLGTGNHLVIDANYSAAGIISGTSGGGVTLRNYSANPNADTSAINIGANIAQAARLPGTVTGIIGHLGAVGVFVGDATSTHGYAGGFIVKPQ